MLFDSLCCLQIICLEQMLRCQANSDWGRHILGKVILATIGDEAAGALQVCAGQQAGCEAAVHAMRMIYKDPSNEAVLLIDATNAFNTLNWNVALLNVNKKCPLLAKVLINTQLSALC